MAEKQLAAEEPAAPAAIAPHDTSHALRGKIGVIELVLMVLAWSAPIVVVSGVASFVIGFAQNGAPLAFGVSAVVLLIFAVGFVTMTRYVENPGAFYAYITAGLGREIGLGAAFLAFAGYFLLGLGTVAFFAVSVQTVVEDILGGPEIAWYVYALVCIVVVALLGYFRVDLSAKVLTVAMILEVGLVGIFDLAVLFQGGQEGLSAEPFTWGAFTSGSISLGILFAATCFSGFEATAVFREEAKDPQRTVPRATYLAVVSIGALYVLSTYALVMAYGANGGAIQAAADDPSGMFPSAMGDYVGIWAKDAVSVLVATSSFAAVLSCQNILSRYCFSLGVDEVLPTGLGKVHERHGSPYRSSILVSVLFLVGTLVILGSGSDVVAIYGKLLGIGGFAILSLIAMTGLAIVAFFARRPQIGESRLRTILAPAVSSVLVIVVLYLALVNFPLLTGGTETDTVIYQGGLWAMFLIGLALAVTYRVLRPGIYAQIGRQSVG